MADHGPADHCLLLNLWLILERQHWKGNRLNMINCVLNPRCVDSDVHCHKQLLHSPVSYRCHSILIFQDHTNNCSNTSSLIESWVFFERFNIIFLSFQAEICSHSCLFYKRLLLDSWNLFELCYVSQWISIQLWFILNVKTFLCGNAVQLASRP